MVPIPPFFSPDETKAIDSELHKLMLQKIIVLTQDEQNEFVSPIFTTVNKDGGIRIILNLKHFNDHVVHRHFKMDTIKTYGIPRS